MVTSSKEQINPRLKSTTLLVSILTWVALHLKDVYWQLVNFIARLFWQVHASLTLRMGLLSNILL